MSNPTTIKAALALLTGPGSLTDPALGCLGEADLAAVNLLLAHHRQQAAALTALLDAAGKAMGLAHRTLNGKPAKAA